MNILARKLTQQHIWRIQIWKERTTMNWIIFLHQAKIHQALCEMKEAENCLYRYFQNIVTVKSILSISNIKNKNLYIYWDFIHDFNHQFSHFLVTVHFRVLICTGDFEPYEKCRHVFELLRPTWQLIEAFFKKIQSHKLHCNAQILQRALDTSVARYSRFALGNEVSSFLSGSYHHRTWHNDAASKAGGWPNIVLTRSFWSSSLGGEYCRVCTDPLYCSACIDIHQWGICFSLDRFFPNMFKLHITLFPFHEQRWLAEYRRLGPARQSVHSYDTSFQNHWGTSWPTSASQVRMEICPPCQLWISLQIRNNI